MKALKTAFAAFATLAVLALAAGSASAAVDYPSYPADTTPFATSSADSPATEIEITISAAAGYLNYVTGVDCTYDGATAASNVVATLEGVSGGTVTQLVGVPVIAAGTVKTYSLPMPGGGEAWPAADDETDIVWTLPTLGTGNLHAACTVRGFSARTP